MYIRKIEFVHELNPFLKFSQDYFVLLPEEFYLATILKQKVNNPCTTDNSSLCREFGYPSITNYDITWGGGGYMYLGDDIQRPMEYFKNKEVLHDMYTIWYIVHSLLNS